MRGPILMAVTAAVVVIVFLMFHYGEAILSGSTLVFTSSPKLGPYLAVHSPLSDIELFVFPVLGAITVYIIWRRQRKDRKKKPRLRSLPGGKRDE